MRVTAKLFFVYIVVVIVYLICFDVFILRNQYLQKTYLGVPYKRHYKWVDKNTVLYYDTSIIIKFKK